MKLRFLTGRAMFCISIETLVFLLISADQRRMNNREPQQRAAGPKVSFLRVTLLLQILWFQCENSDVVFGQRLPVCLRGRGLLHTPPRILRPKY